MFRDQSSIGLFTQLVCPPHMTPPVRAHTTVHSRARTQTQADSPSQSSRVGEGWPGPSDGPSRPHAVAVGSSMGVVPVEGVRGGRKEGMLMGTPVSSFYVRCCHDHPHFTRKKTEALRSQNPALADPKDCSTPILQETSP